MNDLRLGLRSLRRSPGFVLIAVVTLGLGIGANTSAFSLVNEIFLRPLPYPDSDRLERIYRATSPNSRGGVSPADYVDLKSEVNGYGEVAAYAFSDMSLAEPGEPADMASGIRASANLFSTLRIQPELGRSFRPDEEIPGNDRVLMISHRFWQNRFGGDAHIVGGTVRMNGEAHDIVGVLPATLDDWRHLGLIDLFRPLALTASLPHPLPRASRSPGRQVRSPPRRRLPRRQCANQACSAPSAYPDSSRRSSPACRRAVFSS
jgi:hypothetical protein